MKRIVLISIIIIALGAGVGYAQMMEGGMMGHHEEGPGMSQQYYPCQMGPGMMGGYGYGMGHGMMGGYGMGPGMMGGYGMGRGMMGGYGYGMGHGMMGGYGMGPGMMGGYGYGMGRGMMGGCIHDEEQQKFLDETVDLRRKLHNKKFDYFEAMRKADTKPETMSKLREEIRDLKKKIYDKAWK